MSPEAGINAFDKFVDALDYPLFVVTTRSPISGDKAGCLVGFASQTSIDPRRYLVGISRKNFTHQIACEATHLAVHLLLRSSIDVVYLFGGSTGNRVDKFEQCRWYEGPATMPIVSESPAWFVGAILERLDMGDHAGYLVEPMSGSVNDSTCNWVSYADVRDLTPGHEP